MIRFIAWFLFGASILLNAGCNKKEVTGKKDINTAHEGGFLIAKGKEQFLRHCKNCHTIRGLGGNAGPSLDDIGSRMDGTMIRESIIEPSRTVKKGYRDNVMPGNFASVMSEEELDALIFFLTNN